MLTSTLLLLITAYLQDCGAHFENNSFPECYYMNDCDAKHSVVSKCVKVFSTAGFAIWKDTKTLNIPARPDHVNINSDMLPN